MYWIPACAGMTIRDTGMTIRRAETIMKGTIMKGTITIRKAGKTMRRAMTTRVTGTIMRGAMTEKCRKDEKIHE